MAPWVFDPPHERDGLFRGAANEEPKRAVDCEANAFAQPAAPPEGNSRNRGGLCTSFVDGNTRPVHDIGDVHWLTAEGRKVGLNRIECRAHPGGNQGCAKRNLGADVEAGKL